MDYPSFPENKTGTMSVKKALETRKDSSQQIQLTQAQGRTQSTTGPRTESHSRFNWGNIEYSIPEGGEF